MPRYDFLNTKTNEYFDEFMSYEEMVQYLKDNSHIEPANYLNMTTFIFN